jgi:hypothetical protein
VVTFWFFLERAVGQVVDGREAELGFKLHETMQTIQTGDTIIVTERLR